MPDKANRRRFITGAVCPRCALKDKIVVDPETDQRLCVSCGFTEDRPDGNVAEVPTRVSRAMARRIDTPAEPVTLLDDEDS